MRLLPEGEPNDYDRPQFTIKKQSGGIGMIHIYLTGSDRDYTDPDGRIHWGTIENGEVITDNSDDVDDPHHPFGEETLTQRYEDFSNYIDHYPDAFFEPLTDPIAVLENLSHPPFVAAVPSEDGDSLFWRGDFEAIKENGDLTDEERAEVDQYETNDLRLLTRRNGEVIKEHEYPDQYRTVEVGTLDTAQPKGDDDIPTPDDPNRETAFTVHGIWDTNNGEIVEDTSGEFERVIEEMVDNRFPLHDSIALARLSKSGRQLTIIDNNTGEGVSPETVLAASD